MVRDREQMCAALSQVRQKIRFRELSNNRTNTRFHEPRKLIR